MRVLIFIVIVLVLIALVVPRPEPYENYSGDKETVFVSVASYRDAACPMTLRSLFENASHPDRVFVGVCQQNDETLDKDCEDEIPPEFRKNVRIMRLSHVDAKGPTYARYLCSTLLKREDYFLQIDSHCKFAKDWDTKLIRMIKDLKQAGYAKPVLSHYTPDWADYDNPGDTMVTTICKAFINDRGMVSLEGARHQERSHLPQINAFVAGGMLFAEAQCVRDVPYDPDLPFLFVGEEILHSARLWTHGWDIFTPNENVIYHYYTRKGAPRFTDNARDLDADVDAHKKVQSLLGLKRIAVPKHLRRNLDRYGLGTQRSLKGYFKHAGIDVENQSVHKSFCQSKRPTR